MAAASSRSPVTAPWSSSAPWSMPFSAPPRSRRRLRHARRPPRPKAGWCSGSASISATWWPRGPTSLAMASMSRRGWNSSASRAACWSPRPSASMSATALGLTFEDLGPRALKNIDRPVRVHRLLLCGPAVSIGGRRAPGLRASSGPSHRSPCCRSRTSAVTRTRTISARASPRT